MTTKRQLTGRDLAAACIRGCEAFKLEAKVCSSDLSPDQTVGQAAVSVWSQGIGACALPLQKHAVERESSSTTLTVLLLSFTKTGFQLTDVQLWSGQRRMNDLVYSMAGKSRVRVAVAKHNQRGPCRNGSQYDKE